MISTAIIHAEIVTNHDVKGEWLRPSEVCLHLNLIPMKCLAFPLSLQRKMHGLIQQGPDPVTEQTKEAI